MIKKKSKKILVPYWMWIVMVFLLYSLVGAEWNVMNLKTMLFLGQNNDVYNKFVLSGFGHLWYIPFVLSCYLLTPFLQWLYGSVKNKTEKDLFVFLLFFVFGFWMVGRYWKFIGPASYISYYILYSVCFLLWKYYKAYQGNFFNMRVRVIYVGGSTRLILFLRD